MTIKNDVILWNNGKDSFSFFKIPAEQQYKYIDELPCITFGILYECTNYKGCDTFTLFDRFYTKTVSTIEKTYRSLNGAFRIEDIGADTDGYIDFEMTKGHLYIKGQLGASFSSHSLRFEFEADQTLVGNLLQTLTV